MRFIKRDPFARTALFSSKVATQKTCDWCGQNNKGYLYCYTVEHDAGRKETVKGLFCCVGCMRDYHE
jgi:hypothetical protein